MTISKTFVNSGVLVTLAMAFLLVGCLGSNRQVTRNGCRAYVSPVESSDNCAVVSSGCAVVTSMTSAIASDAASVGSVDSLMESLRLLNEKLNELDERDRENWESY